MPASRIWPHLTSLSLSCSQLCQMRTEFWNSCSASGGSKLVMQPLLKLPPHYKQPATLSVKYMEPFLTHRGQGLVLCARRRKNCMSTVNKETVASRFWPHWCNPQWILAGPSCQAKYGSNWCSRFGCCAILSPFRNTHKAGPSWKHDVILNTGSR